MQAELFRDRTAIVTGGARGIGLACAAKITAGGGRVALWDRDIERAPWINDRRWSLIHDASRVVAERGTE